jgi:diadenosine tetraphosphate (Ap4A) HIT family hydrolase
VGRILRRSISRAAAVVAVTRPDHANIESLGNVVPHLRWHIVPRYVADPYVGRPREAVED